MRRYMPHENRSFENDNYNRGRNSRYNEPVSETSSISNSPVRQVPHNPQNIQFQYEDNSNQTRRPQEHRRQYDGGYDGRRYPNPNYDAKYDPNSDRNYRPRPQNFPNPASVQYREESPNDYPIRGGRPENRDAPDQGRLKYEYNSNQTRRPQEHRRQYDGGYDGRRYPNPNYDTKYDPNSDRNYRPRPQNFPNPASVQYREESPNDYPIRGGRPENRDAQGQGRLKSPLSHSPDYVDPKYGQRPVYDFGFGPGKPLGLRPSTPPPIYTEPRPSYYPGTTKLYVEEPKNVYSAAQPQKIYQTPVSPSHAYDNQGMYRKRQPSMDRSPRRHPHARDASHSTNPRSTQQDNRSIASSGGRRPKSIESTNSQSFETKPQDLPESMKKNNKLEMIRGGKEREQWDNKVQYLLAVIGYAVGLGNIWRFPYLAQKNGGGAFLIPYLVMLVIEGFPLLILELHIGQRFRRGPLLAFRDLSKYAVGIGMACMVSSFLSACYYNTVISWCIFYMGMSLRKELAWENCPGSANENSSAYQECSAGAGPASYFWYRETLNIADSIEDAGGLSWKVFLSTMAAWILICACLIKGIKSSGKVVYFTATFPYLVLTIFLIRGVTLEGAGDGLKHLFKPDLGKIFDGQVWREAASQIFFTLSLAGGGLISMSSYNSYNNNYAKDALIVAVANSLTSLYAGCVVFSIVGHIATEQYKECNLNYESDLLNGLVQPDSNNCSLKDFMTDSVSGSGLVFITIARACTEFGGAGPFFSFVFYFMLITLGMDSMFGILEAVTTSLTDLQLLKNVKQAIIVAICCGCGFLLGITFTSTTGEYVFQMFDEYVASYPLFIIAFSEVAVAGWLYGIDNFAQDFYLMTGQRPFTVLLVMIKYVCPFVMIIIFISNIINLGIDGASYARYDKTQGTTVSTAYPGWAKFINTMLTLVATAYIPVMAVYVFLTKKRLFAYDETEVFPDQELFEHYDLADKSPYYPYTLMSWPCRRGVSVADSIRENHRSNVYYTKESAETEKDRTDNYESNSAKEIRTAKSNEAFEETEMENFHKQDPYLSWNENQNQDTQFLEDEHQFI